MRAAIRAPILAAALVMAIGAPTWAQDTRSVSPGMTADAVRAALGQPLYERAYGEHAYFFYDNGCEKECGFLDLVILQNGQVVDAVFRSPRHHYTGESSSPKGVIPRPTPGGEQLQMPEGRVEGVEIRPTGRDSVPPGTRI